MRPTLLNFRCPKERTPEFYDNIVTKNGQYLNFKTITQSKKLTTIPQTKRFECYKTYSVGSGVSSFLGPGTYNDHENYIKLSKTACSTVMVS
jgi:hypothetical protein